MARMRSTGLLCAPGEGGRFRQIRPEKSLLASLSEVCYSEQRFGVEMG